jgi:hypothetical protein
MDSTPPISPRDPGAEIKTKHKEAIRQLHKRAKYSVELLMAEYHLGKSTLCKILNYDIPERARPMHTGRPKLLSDVRVDEIIEILSNSWENRILNFAELQAQFAPECSTNCCQRFRTKHGIILIPHPSTSPDMNPIEKYWRYIKQKLYRRRTQPTTVAEMEVAVREEWERIPQQWINDLILKQEHWVTVLMERHGWSTPN